MNTEQLKCTERRLAAIVMADIAGYSRLMEADEAATAEALREHYAAVNPILESHGGRIVDTAGDGMFLEFPSIVSAVECAVAIQKLMAERNEDVPIDLRMLFRIGINIGDVLIEGDKIKGDAVNIAARLESIAEAGGICLSGTAVEYVRGKLNIAFDDWGERTLKNIARPVRVYAIRQEASPVRGYHAAGVPRLSLIVLPFDNLGGDPEQEYFVDGLTEDLTTELSRLLGAFVIARNTAFTFKGKPVDVKQIGRELGVRYVLEGSVRKAGQRIRTSAQLIDAVSGAHVWADRFDREITELFELQDAITLDLARILDVQLVEAESRRSQRSLNLDALDLELQARALCNRGYSRENITAAIRLYEQALQIDPDYVPALAGLGETLYICVASLWSEARENDLARAEAAAERALELEPQNAWCHYSMGGVRRMQNRFEEAIVHLETAIRLNPNLHSAHSTLGFTEIAVGRFEESLPRFVESIRLSPRDPSLFLGYFGIGWGRFVLGEDVEATDYLRRSVAENPGFSPARMFLTASYGMQGRIEDARAALAAYFRTGTVATTIAQLRANPQSEHPVYLERRERLYEGLRRAGMPEE